MVDQVGVRRASGVARTPSGPEVETPTGGLHRFATGPVAIVALLVALAHVVAASVTTAYWLDEVYMLAIGRHHLDWGSADQPPITPALAWLMDTIAPGDLFVLRLPAVLATTAAVVVAALIARELGGDRRAQTLTAAAQATGLFAALSGNWLTPYALEPLEWVVVFWLLVRWIRLRDDRLLLGLGLAVGVALLTKFQIVALCAVLVVAIAVCGPRALLTRPLLGAGGVIALVVALPTLVWQALHGWPQLAMTSVVAHEVEVVYGGRPTTAWELLVFGGLLALGLALPGLWWAARDPRWRAYRFLALGYVALYVLFLVTAGRPYYLTGYAGVMAAIGAVGFQVRRETTGRTRRWPAWVAGSLSAVVALGVLGVGPGYAASIGSRDVAVAVAIPFHRLPDPEHTGIVAQNYLIAADVDGYSTQFGLPAAYSTNRGYGYFDPPPETDTAVLYAGPDPAELRPYFRGVRHLDGSGQTSTWLLTGRTAPWASFWPGLRHLDVI